VVIGVADDFAGALAPERLNNLAPLWKQIADGQNLQVAFSQNTHDQEKYFVPAELQKHLVNLFFQTKQNLDKHLEEHGFIDFSKLFMSEWLF